MARLLGIKMERLQLTGRGQGAEDLAGQGQGGRLRGGQVHGSQGQKAAEVNPLTQGQVTAIASNPPGKTEVGKTSTCQDVADSSICNKKPELQDAQKEADATVGEKDVITDKPESGGLVSVEVYGEDEAIESSIKTEPEDYAEKPSNYSEIYEKPKEPELAVSVASTKRRDVYEEEDLNRRKKMKLLYSALDNLKVSKSPIDNNPLAPQIITQKAGKTISKEAAETHKTHKTNAKMNLIVVGKGKSKKNTLKSETMKSNTKQDGTINTSSKFGTSNSGITKPGNPKIKTATSFTTKSGTPKSGTTKLATPKSGTTKSGTTMSGTPKSGTNKHKSATPKSGTTKLSTLKSGKPKTNNTKFGYPKSGTTKSNTAKPDKTKLGTSKFSTPKSGKPKSRHQTPKAALVSQVRAQAKDLESACNYSLKCELCQNESKTLTQLQNHVSIHFKKELETKHSALMDGLNCSLCGKVFKAKSLLLAHIGCKHGKINDVLKEQNYRVLPCPINTPCTTETQANLKARMKIIKKEPFADKKAEKIQDYSEAMGIGETHTDVSKIYEAPLLTDCVVKSEPADQA